MGCGPAWQRIDRFVRDQVRDKTSDSPRSENNSDEYQEQCAIYVDPLLAHRRALPATRNLGPYGNLVEARDVLSVRSHLHSIERCCVGVIRVREKVQRVLVKDVCHEVRC
jgi:hypothetical protein